MVTMEDFHAGLIAPRVSGVPFRHNKTSGGTVFPVGLAAPLDHGGNAKNQVR